jgi:hypothetical protein
MMRVGETTTPDPGSTQTPGEPPPVATTQAQPPETPPETAVAAAEVKGPIPFDRHEAILKNARVKTEQEVTQRFQQQYGPHVELGSRIQADPVGTVVQLVNELSEHPEYGSHVISALARTLGARRGLKAQTAADEAPQPDLVTQDGTIQAYSADRLAEIRAYDRQQILKEVDARLTPFQQREEQQLIRERHEAAVKDANTRMAKVLEPFRALPEFKENQTAIAAKTKALMDDGHDPQTALGLAVANILREVVLPTKTAQSRNELVAQAVAKSTGSTTVPGQTPAAPAKRPTSMAEGFASIKF